MSAYVQSYPVQQLCAEPEKGEEEIKRSSWNVLYIRAAATAEQEEQEQALHYFSLGFRLQLMPEYCVYMQVYMCVCSVGIKGGDLHFSVYTL